MGDETTIKEKILQATIDLMREDTLNITVRKIAAHAGVTQGLINYHFQSKDNLINIAAQHFVDKTISSVSDSFDQFQGDPHKMLREMMKKTLDYLIGHPNVSRLSILRDLQSGQSSDNMQSSINAYDKLLRYIIPDQRQRFLAGHIFCTSLQGFFMRFEVLQETQGIDIADPAVRGQFVDDLIDTVLKGVI